MQFYVPRTQNRTNQNEKIFLFFIYVSLRRSYNYLFLFLIKAHIKINSNNLTDIFELPHLYLLLIIIAILTRFVVFA